MKSYAGSNQLELSSVGEYFSGIIKRNYNFILRRLGEKKMFYMKKLHLTLKSFVLYRLNLSNNSYFNVMKLKLKPPVFFYRIYMILWSVRCMRNSQNLVSDGIATM